MKIGILTFHYAKNYGAVLQTYALLSKIRELGHDVWIINRIPDYTNLLRWLYHHLSYKHIWGWLRFKRFSRQYLLPKTKLYQTQSSIIKGFPEDNFDAVVVGSDQVWRWNYRMIGFNYFLDFIPQGGVKKISYAASFGLSEWNDTPQNTTLVKQLLQSFAKVSVRENTGVEICKNYFDREAELVVDPTLLFARDFYESTLLKDYPLQENNRVVSIMLSKPKQSIELSRWAKERGMEHNELSRTYVEEPGLFWNTIRHLQHITVQEWLNEIRNAKYVVTNSFHATVFALLFEKPFVVVDLPRGGSNRIETLLEYVGLENHFVKDLRDIDNVLEQSIDYSSVHAKLDEMRKVSIGFLKSCF